MFQEPSHAHPESLVNRELPQHLAVIDYWNTVEFFNFFDLSEATRDLPPDSLFDVIDPHSMPWADHADAADYKYTIFLGVTNAKEISEALQTDEDDVLEKEKDKDKLTCVGKITLEEEGGVTRLDYVGLSTLNWAISHFLCGKVPLLSGFADYQSSLLTYTNREICPHFARHSLKSIPSIYITRVYQHFLSSNHSHGNVCDLWKPRITRFKVLRQNRNKTSHFVKYVKSYLKITEDMQQAADQIFRQYLAARSSDDENAMEKAARSLLTFLGGLERIDRNDPVKIDQKFIDTMIEEIFSVREIEILNSFYLDDLEAAHRYLSRPRPPSLLRSYLTSIEAYANLFDPSSKEVLLEATRPRVTPPGRWPFDPAHGLSLMQQFAVNKAIGQAPRQLFSVNGPPGTGKTTLCKDLIANIMVQRAAVLADLRQPSNAFHPTHMHEIKGFRFPPLIPELTGFEILIASGNNGAVENISKELPLLAGIASEFQDQLSHLRPCAHLMEGPRTGYKEKTWGLFSVPLGNRRNIEQFLTQIAPLPIPGQPAQFEDEIHSLGQWQKLPRMGRETFAQAQESFRLALSRVQEEAERLDRLYACAMRYLRDAGEYERLRRQLDELKTEVAGCSAEIQASEKKKLELTQIEAGLPRMSWIQRLFSWGKARQEKEMRHKLAEERFALFRRGVELEASLGQLQEKHSAVESDLQSLEATREEYVRMPPDLLEQAELLKLELDDPSLQITTPFQTPSFNRLRSQVFLAAMNLHEAWLEEVKKQAAIRCFAYNLRDILTQRKVRESPAGRALLQMLFFFFPVVSTTFAAARTFLRYIPFEGLGWLIIDEAGQATPQAAVGAILRCRRALIVGDPLQLEPIITLPSVIQRPIQDHFKQELEQAHLYDPFFHSVQTLADRSHPWGAKIHGDQRLGCPLRVHRRCSNPMFSLSNAIAYDGKMILGKNDGIPHHGELGSSCWFHLEGAADGRRGHWVKNQGRFVLEELLARISSPTGDGESVFVIAPFREVVAEFKRLVKTAMKSWLHDFPLSVKWLNTSVGTVHTFQGKEADIVILILGLDKTTRYAAQAIIGSKPNFLNVATTRARKHFYIVGNVEIWQDVFSFDVAARMLPVHREHGSAKNGL